MNYSDVFIKSDLGRREIKSNALGILPREARTLLIMIDGKRTYQSYLDALDNGKMFAEFGGVTPLFELLLELDCIEIAGQQKSDIQQQVDTQPQPVAEPVKETSAAEFDRTFNTTKDSGISSSSASTSQDTNSNYKAIKSELAAHIEENALPEEAWGYLLNLEQCNAPAELLGLIKQIQTSSNRQLTNNMDDFAKKLAPYV